MTIAELYAYRAEMQSCIKFFKSRDHELYLIFKDESRRVGNILNEWFTAEIKQIVRRRGV